MSNLTLIHGGKRATDTAEKLNKISELVRELFEDLADLGERKAASDLAFCVDNLAIKMGVHHE